MRIKQMIINSNLSKMRNKILPTCLQGNYRDSLREFSNTSYGVFESERVKGAQQKVVIRDYFRSRLKRKFRKKKNKVYIIRMQQALVFSSSDSIRAGVHPLNGDTADPRLFLIISCKTNQIV